MPKELTQQQIKQLEENANLMKENGFSDEDIQDMSLQYIEEHGVVKKKENTTSSTQKSSTSSSGVSSSNSQSQNRTATQFKPLTEQQKVAGKSILGEGTKVVETQKKQQTQVKPTYPTTQELIKKSGGTGSDNLKTIQDNTVQIADIIDKFGQPDLRTDTQKQEEEDRIAKEKFKNKADLELIQDVSNFGSTDLKQNILDYYDINLKDNDAFNRLTETDKQLYNSIKQYNDIYSKINTLTEQYNNKNIGEDAYQQELKKLNTDRIKYELQTTNFINNRNKDIDNEIKQLKQNIYAGKMPNPKYNPIEPQYSMANNAKEITLTDADKKNLQNQIKILEKQKGLFTDNTKQQEVIDSYNSEIADLTKKKIIPDGADAKEALKILYTRKYKQLQMLIQQSENEGKASISSQGGLWGKAKEFIADAMAQDFTNNQKSRAGYENTLRQYMIDDKTATKIYELQDELNTLAPIVLLNRYGNYKNESEWKKFTNSFATKMLPTQQGKITTATEIAQNTDKILNELGLQQQEDVTGNDIQKGKYSTGEMLGNTVAFMVQFGLAPDPISKALRGFKLLSKIPKLKGLVTKIDDVVKYSQKSKLGRFLGDATMSGINYETKGQIFSGKQALGDEATFESGFAGVLGEKTFSSLYKILGGNIKVLEPLIRMGGKGVGELGEETAQTIIQTAQEAGSFDEMVEDLKMQFPTMKDVGFFAISTFMMGMAFGANPELSRTWNNWRDKKLDALKKEGKYTEEDEKIVNEAISELQSEHKESVKEDLKNGIKVTEEEAQSIIENGTENEDGNIEIKDENGEDIVILDKENLTIVAKDFDKIFELDSSGTSASTKDKVLIANKLNNGEKLSGEEQDYYDTYKEEIEQLRTSKNENKITSTEPTNTGQEQINSTGVSTEKSNNTELGETSEQGLPTEQKEVQQNTAEIQKEIDDTKQIITELENNPNSPFHKLVNLEDKRKELVELENKQAELKALEQQDAKVSNQSKIEDKKADIERRRQEELNRDENIEMLYPLQTEEYLTKGDKERIARNEQDNKGLFEQKTPTNKAESSAENKVKIKYGGEDKDLKGNPKKQWMLPTETSEQATKRIAGFVEASDFKGREQSAYIDKKGENIEVKLRNDNGKWNWYEPKSKKPFASFNSAKEAIKYIQEQPFWNNGELNKDGRNDAYFAKIKADYIKTELENGNILEDINDGKISATEAKLIIESYGLKVPKDIAEQSLKETTQSETELQSKGDNILNEFNPLLELDGDGIKTQETRIDEDYNTTDAEYEQTKFLIPVYNVDWHYADNTNPDSETFDTLKDAVRFAQKEGDMSENTSDTPYNRIYLTFKEVWKDKGGNIVEEGDELIFDDALEELPQEIIDLFDYKDGDIATIAFESNHDIEKREQQENNLIDDIKHNIYNKLKKKYPNYELEKAGFLGQSSYIKIKLNNGRKILLRISNHNANTNNLERNFKEDSDFIPDYVFSIVIQNKKIDIVKRFDNSSQMQKILAEKNPNVETVQVIYDLGNIKALGEHGIVDEIMTAIENAEENNIFYSDFSGTQYQAESTKIAKKNQRLKKISIEKFNKLINKLKKAFPKVKVNFFNKDSEVEKILGTTWENVKAQVSNVEKRKNKQLQIINKTNPAPNNYNTWIRSTGDILTAEEAFKTAFEDGNMYPDFTVEDMKNALNRGKITVYSSYPIRKGVFVSPSKMMAEDYAGGKGGKVYSKEIDIKDLAWIDEAEGQYAPVKFLRTPQGTIYGFVKDGQIYLNADEVNANTPIHEFGHIWEQLFPKEFAKGIELLMASEQGRAYIKKIRQNPAYAGRTLDEVKAEALVTAIGDKGETIFNNNPTLLKKFQDWLKDFFKTIGDKLGIINLSADERFEDFTKKVVGDLLGGKELKGESKAENIIAFQQDYAIESDFKKDSKGNIKKDEQGNPILTEKAKKEIAEEYAEIEKRYNGKAPNGKPSKLTKEQWILTRTSRFKDWFGEWENDPENASKVIDENGEPLVVYHGTSTGGFTEFKGNKPIFFTNSKSVADTYQQKQFEGKKQTYPIFLNIKNIEQIDGQNSDFASIVVTEDTITSKQTRLSATGIYESVFGFRYPKIVTAKKGDGKTNGVLIKNIYDNILGNKSTEPSDVYIVPYPNQIKSATDNVGTFDAGNNDIRFQIEEESNTPQQNETVKNLRNSFIKLMNLGKDLDFVFAMMDKNNLIYDKDKITNLWNKTKAEIEQEYKNNLNDEQKTEDSIAETETKESGGNRKKRTFYYGRAYLGDLPKEVKDKMSKYDFDYTIQNQAKAEKEALEIINDIGLETAFELARTGKIRGGHKAIIYSKALEDINEKMLKTNDQIEKENLRDVMTDILNEFSDQLKEGGQFASMMARIYKNSNLSYNADWRIKKYKDANNGEIPKEVEERFKELEEIIKAKDKEIAELEQKQKEAVTNDAITQIKEKAKSRKKEKLSVKTRIFADKFRRKLKTKPPVFTDEDGNEIEITQNAILSWNEIVEFGAKAIETSASLLEAVEKTISKLEEQEWYQKLSGKNKKKAKDALLEAFDEDNIIDEYFKIPKDVLYDLVEKGLSENQDYNIDNLVDDVYDLLGDSSLDKRDLRDKITNYEEQLKDTRDDIEKKITELKRTGKLLSAYEDLQNGIMPIRSGLTRDEMTLEQRDLRKQINELLKQMPQSEEEQSKIWKSALDVMEKRLTNELQKERDEMLGKTELSPEAKIKMFENLLTKNIKNLEDTIRFVNQHNSLPETKPKEKISSERIEELKAERQKQKETLNELLKQKGIAEKKRIELAKKRVQKSINDLKTKLENKDFSKTKRKPLPFEEELNKARIDRLKAKEEFDVAMYKAELDNRTKKQKVFDLFLDILNLPKALKATIDLSAPLRQGATLLATHPTIWKDAFVDMHKMAKNENVYNERLSNIKNADDFLLMMESGLSITDTDAKLKAKEELFMTDLPKKIPVFKFFHGASERAYSGFLNDLRVGVFRDGVRQLQNAGITYEDDPGAYKSLAKMVNNATGRGRSVTKDEDWNKILNTLFFSPKMIMSRFGMIADMFSNNDIVRKMAIKNMAGFVAYYGTLTALSSLAVSRYSDDDDDKDALKNSFNPLHTDFMKMRKGHTTYDLTAGFSQIFRTMARVMSGKRINSQNKEYNLDGSGYQRENRLSEIGRFLSNKFSPSARVIISTLLNKHPTDYYGKLEDATIKDYLEALLIPMSLEQAYELYTNDEIKASEAFLMTLLATYGVGVQQESSSNNKNSSKLRTETNKK